VKVAAKLPTKTENPPHIAQKEAKYSQHKNNPLFGDL